MNLAMQGRVVMVTGAGSGIGRAITTELAEEGVVVVGVDVVPDAVMNIENVRAVQADVRSPAAMSEAFELCSQLDGPLYGLVNCVGHLSGRSEGFLAITDEQWRESFEVNFLAAMSVSRMAIEMMLAFERGVVINISSIAAREPAPWEVDYAAMKAALIVASKALSTEYGRAGMRVLSVSPGPTRTPAFHRAIDELARSTGRATELVEAEHVAGTRSISTGRLGSPLDVAKLVVFLLSDHAGQITGSDFRVDGGGLRSV